MPPKGWKDYQVHVLAELQRLSKSSTTMDTKLDEVRLDIAGLKIKSGIWGLIGGMIPIVILLGIWVLKTL